MRRQDHYGIAKDPEGDRRQAGQDIADESDGVTQPVASILGKKDADQRANGHRQQGGHPHDFERADDRVQNAATRDTLGVRRVGKEPRCEQAGQTFDDDEEQEHQDGNSRNHDAQRDQRRHEPVEEDPDQRAAHVAMGSEPVKRQTRSRARTLTAMVIRTRTSPR